MITLILALPSAASTDGGGELRALLPCRSVPDASRAALTALYEAASGARWYRRDNWLSGDPCDRQSPWFGVGCSAGATVGAIQLGSNGLEGVVPSELALLTELSILELYEGSLSGTISTELYSGKLS